MVKFGETSTSVNDVVGGIKENTLDDIILELGNKTDDIGTVFQEIEMLFYDMNEFFKGDNADSIKNKFDEFSNQFVTAKKNFESYQNDLIVIKNWLLQSDKSSVKLLHEFTESINADAKKIQK